MSFFAQLLLALQHLHQRKILHRDIKTKNVFVTKENKIKLGDFGLSKMLDASTSYTASAVGTPYYLSPELCEGKSYNNKSDVWALGCLLYELCTFKHAFDATSLPALVMCIIKGEIEPITQPYSVALLEAIQLCLRKDPERRPSVDELLALPVLEAELKKRGREVAAEMAGTSGVERPLFTQGHVETVLSQVSSSRAGLDDAMPFTNDAVLSELEEAEEFVDLLQSLRHALDIQDRVVNRVPWIKCFLGRDLVDHLVADLRLPGREQAVAVGRKWLDAGVFHHVGKSEGFSDSEALFRFQADEIPIVLNVKEVLRGPAPPPAEVTGGLERAMRACVDSCSTTGSDGASMVDYESMAVGDAFQEWCAAAQELQRLQLSALPYTDRIALLVNLYNMLLVHGFITIGPPHTPQQRQHFMCNTAYAVCGQQYSLQDIHHGLLRANKKPPNAYTRVFGNGDERARVAAVVWDPRIHFALNHGTKGSPPLRVYSPATLDRDLDEAVRGYLARHMTVQTVRANPHGGGGTVKVVLPAFVDTFREDFGGSDGAVLRWVAQYVPERDQLLDALADRSVRLSFRELDVTINKTLRPAPPGGAGGGVRRSVMARIRNKGGRAGTPDGESGRPGSRGPPPPGPPRAPAAAAGSMGSADELAQGLSGLGVVGGVATGR